MARPSGRWLAYLKFDYRGEARALHLLTDNRAQLDEVLGLLKGNGPDDGELVEYAIFQSGRNVYLEEGPNFRERHVLTYAEFMARWRAATNVPGPSPSRSGSSPLGRVFDAPQLT